MPNVWVEDINVDFGAVRAIDRVSFDVEDGTMVGLLGPSGCGKSTLLRTIAGLINATSGRIRIGETDIYNSETDVSLPPEKRDLGMVFQSYAIWPHMTVEENIGFPLKVRKVDKEKTAERVAAALRLVNMEGFGRRPASNLSGGQQQRVAIARSLAFEPRVLLFDEPLSNVDAKLRQQMGRELRSIQKNTGITAIYVTHDQSEALSMCDKIVLLEHGRVQQIGTPREIYHHPANSFVGDFIGYASMVSGIVIDDDGQKVPADGVSVAVEDRYKFSVPVRGVVPTPGAKVKLLVRPEDVVVAQSGSGIEAIVESAHYFGDRWFCTARFANQRLTFFCEKHQQPQEGQSLTLAMMPSSLFVE